MAPMASKFVGSPTLSLSSFRTPWELGTVGVKLRLGQRRPRILQPLKQLQVVYTSCYSPTSVHKFQILEKRLTCLLGHASQDIVDLPEELTDAVKDTSCSVTGLRCKAHHVLPRGLDNPMSSYSTSCPSMDSSLAVQIIFH